MLGVTYALGRSDEVIELGKNNPYATFCQGGKSKKLGHLSTSSSCADFGHHGDQPFEHPSLLAIWCPDVIPFGGFGQEVQYVS